MSVCPYCKDIVGDQDAWYCPICETPHHAECRESNHGMCSVYGCKSRSDDEMLGCPICEEAYSGHHTHCVNCGQPLMTATEIADFLERYQWEILPSESDWNPILTAGYLRNNGIVARLNKKTPISMLGLSPKISVLVPSEQLEEARNILGTLAERFQPCPDCGHTLFIDEEECSFCTESSGAQT